MPAKARVNRDSLEAIAEYLNQLKMAGLPQPQFEYRFMAPYRQFRSDFAWVDLRVLGEFEGGVFVNGAHTRGAHYESDCEKYSLASILGFTLVRFTSGMVRRGLALQLTEKALAAAAER